MSAKRVIGALIAVAVIVAAQSSFAGGDKVRNRTEANKGGATGAGEQAKRKDQIRQGSKSTQSEATRDRIRDRDQDRLRDGSCQK